MANLFSVVLIFVTQAALAQNNESGKGLTIPRKIVCSVLDEGTMAKNGQVTILSDFGADPLVIVKSSTEPLLNFRIGRGFAAGEFHKQGSDLICENKISKDKSPLYFEYSCRYVNTTFSLAKSRFVYSTSGAYFREVCRDVMPAGMGGNICWKLADCK